MVETASVPLEALRPVRKDRVIDLVRAAGLDVADWSNRRRVEPGAGSNPKYCYEWAFVEPGAGVVLNLWHEELSEEPGGRIVRIGNFRQDAANQIARGRASPWGRRARQMDEALQMAFRDSLEIRVILNDGIRRNLHDPEATASKVQRRQLDPERWAIADYDFASGAHRLVRGEAPARFVDQFTADDATGGPAPRRDQTGSVFVRDAHVRQTALRRANGCCEYCGVRGFQRADGAIYLETHHVIPLQDDGPDTVGNVICLCPNHHREAHFGENAARLRIRFQDILADVARVGAVGPSPLD